MTEVQSFIDQIPIRHNWISMVQLCGIVQGFLLSLVIFFRNRPENQSIRFFGFFIFFISLILTDNYLCYTGLMKYILHLNDSTEVFVLFIGPTIYFFLKSILRKEKITLAKHWIHFVLPIFYFLNQLQYYFSPIEVKLNAYLGAYFPSLGFVDYDYSGLYFLMIKDEFRWFILFSFLIYIILIIRMGIRNVAKFQNSFLEFTGDKYGFSKNAIVLLMLTFGIIFFVFWNNETDAGDHIISLFLTVCIFLISFSILAQSKFFEKSWVADKYDTSGLQSNHQDILQQVQVFFKTKKYFLNKDASLKDLSTQMQLPSNYISQAINHETQQNFNDFINQYRIEEVKDRLKDDAYSHLNIAGIGQTVGFKSKSAFYAAFKKFTQMTPTEFLNHNN